MRIAAECSASVGMRYLKTSEAATLLNVSPNTLRAWERRFGYPKPHRSPGRHRLYTYGEVATLRDALQEGLSISSAVSRAQEGLGADTDTLVGALGSFENERADAAIEAALALRSVDRSVEEILLPALDELVRRHGLESASWAFAARWADEWLRRARRLAPPPIRPFAILIGDATGDEVDPDRPYVRALELVCARAGSRVLSSSVRGVGGLGDLLASLRPDVIVIAGGQRSDDAVARWAYAARAAVGPLPTALYHRDTGSTRVRTTGAHTLPVSPAAAHAELLGLTDGSSWSEPAVDEDLDLAPTPLRRLVASGRGRH